jgi:hypothetical protein
MILAGEPINKDLQTRHDARARREPVVGKPSEGQVCYDDMLERASAINQIAITSKTKLARFEDVFLMKAIAFYFHLTASPDAFGSSAARLLQRAVGFS